jgi:hypothetical protein
MTRLRARLASTARTAALAAGLLANISSAAAAQQAGPGPRWQAWLGCWTAAPAADLPVPVTAGAPLVCITPTADANVVAVTTLSGGKTVSTQRIDASGRDEPIMAKGCTGTQRARWSADERRVYLRAVATCDGVQRTTSGILAMTPAGEWLDVQGVAAGEGENVRVARYHDAGIPSSVPAEIATALSGRTMSAQGARIAAGATVGTVAVVEASRASSAGVVEAWLLERGQTFALTARDLVALADAGVPARVTDAMVAVSNPKTFAIAHPDARARRDPAFGDDVVGQRIYVTMEPMSSPWGWGYSPYGYSPYGYSPYGYGYGSSAYGYPGYFSTAPVIILNRPDATTAHGRIVKGHGYTPAEQTGTAAASPSSSSGSSSSSGRSSAPSSSGSSQSGSSQSGARTAKPRP